MNTYTNLDNLAIEAMFDDAITNKVVGFIESNKLKDAFKNALIPLYVDGNKDNTLVYDFLNKAEAGIIEYITSDARPARKYKVGTAWIKVSILKVKGELKVMLEWASTTKTTSKFTSL